MVITRQEARDIWLENPSQLELISKDMPTAREEGEIKRFMNDFKEETGLIKYKPEFTHRIVGEGLFHSSQLSLNEIEIDTIFGTISGRPSAVAKEIEEIKSSNSTYLWLKTIFAEKAEDLLWLIDKESFYEEISKKLSNTPELPVSTIRNVPEQVLGGVILWAWSQIVKYPGVILDAFYDDQNNIVVTVEKSGKFVGEKGRNVQTIEQFLKKNISVHSTL